MAGRRKPAALAGTHLYLDSRGIYIWRRVDPLNKRRRVKRSTGARTLERALRMAAQFEEQRERRRVGLRSVDGWRTELTPLVPAFVASVDAGEPVRAHLSMAIGRALEELKVHTAADLDDVAALDDRLRALGLAKTKARRCYQDPLRRFSRWLAANNRVVDRDPLKTWEPIKAPKGKSRKRRALTPEEFAWALRALDVLDMAFGRPHPTAPTFLALLVAGARAGAFVGLDLVDLDAGAGRLNLGEDVGCKRKGAAALDATTLEELVVATAERDEGPLFLSPAGGRWQTNRLRTVWREGVSLGLVLDLWPTDVPLEELLAVNVSSALLSGRSKASRGGNPKRFRPETVARRRAEDERVLALAARLRPTWAASMVGVDVHALRRTHRTWARARRVLGEAIDAQLGWATTEDADTTAALRAAAGSRTGQRFYGVDAGSALFDPRLSAEAVRAVVDEARAAVAHRVAHRAPIDQPTNDAARA